MPYIRPHITDLDFEELLHTTGVDRLSQQTIEELYARFARLLALCYPNGKHGVQGD